MNSKVMIVAVLAVILGAAAGFFGGIKYQQSKTPASRFGNLQGNRNGQGTAAVQRFGQGFRPVNGEIISQDDKGMTVKMSDNSTRIILVTDSTVINKAAGAGKTDLKVGEKVAVFGTQNSDGSVTAQNIQLNPPTGGQP